MMIEEILRNQKIAIFNYESEDLFKELISYQPNSILIKNKKISGYNSDNIFILKEEYKSFKDVRRNNANIIFLNNSAVLSTKKFKYFGQAEYIFIKISFLGILNFIPSYMRYAKNKRLLFLQTVKLAGSYWMIFKNNNPKYISAPRLWFDKSWSWQELSDKLQNLNYSLLRWYDKIEEFGEKDDLDILIYECDLSKLKDIINIKIGTKPMDVYTISGHDNYGIMGISYFPPQNSIQLLENSIKGRYNFKIPNNILGYVSFTYHLMFHKVIKNKLDNNILSENSWSDKKYYLELIRLSQRANLKLPENFDDLENILKFYNWFPPQDTLSVYAKKSLFINHRYFGDDLKVKPGLSVYIFRDIAQKYDLIDDGINLLKKEGFEILDRIKLNDNEIEVLKNNIRGGNWYTPKDREDEGGPHEFIIAYDKNPVKLTKRKLQKRYPRIDNARILVKRKMRDNWAKRFKTKHFNALHATDNSLEALDYIKILSTYKFEQYKNLVD